MTVELGETPESVDRAAPQANQQPPPNGSAAGIEIPGAAPGLDEHVVNEVFGILPIPQ
jgi:hypothetical protein